MEAGKKLFRIYVIKAISYLEDPWIIPGMIWTKKIIEQELMQATNSIHDNKASWFDRINNIVIKLLVTSVNTNMKYGASVLFKQIILLRQIWRTIFNKANQIYIFKNWFNLKVDFKS